MKNNLNKMPLLRHLTEIMDGRLVVTVKTEMKFKDGAVIPVGTQLICEFPQGNLRTFVINFEGRQFKIGYTSAGKYLNKFKTEPSMNALEKMSNDGIATTPLGSRTEPDGYGQYGEPSWLLVLGLI